MSKWENLLSARSSAVSASESFILWLPAHKHDNVWIYNGRQWDYVEGTACWRSINPVTFVKVALNQKWALSYRKLRTPDLLFRIKGLSLKLNSSDITEDLYSRQKTAINYRAVPVLRKQDPVPWDRGSVRELRSDSGPSLCTGASHRKR